MTHDAVNFEFVSLFSKVNRSLQNRSIPRSESAAVIFKDRYDDL